MKKSLLFLSVMTALLGVHASLAAELPDSSIYPVFPDTAALPSDDPLVGGGRRAGGPDSVSVSPTCGVVGAQAAPSLYVYPRLALGTSWLADWLKKPEGMAFLYQFQEIYGPITVEDILLVKQRARAENHAAWADSTRFIMGDCLVTTGEMTSPPPDWLLGYARNNVSSAINLAVYMNQQRNVDWFLRDIHGQKMKIWSDAHFAINLTPDCPVGAWDGTFTYQGRRYSVGDTRGLTFLQWLKGPFTRTVIRGSLFAQAFDGLQAEDWPSTWLYYFNGQIPDPRRDGVGFPSWADFETYCGPAMRSWYLDFLKPLQDKFIVRINNCHLRWFFMNWANPAPEIQEAVNGCKLERYFGPGGWPSDGDRPMWDQVYKAMERLYHPLSADPKARGFDRRQGWDVTVVQLNTPSSWSSDEIDQYKRSGLASTLMGDGLLDGTAFREDYGYALYLRQGQVQYAPRDIPEMRVKLGQALGPASQYTIDPAHPLDYRRFYDAETKRVYTVVSNVWDVPVAGIPAQDGAWFLGLWPAGEYQALTFNPGKSNQSPIPGDDESGAGMVDAARGTLRAVPSVTRAASRFGLAAPAPSTLEVSIVGVDGRLVRSLTLAGGQESVEWDGCDSTGRRVAPGLYFARAGAGADRRTARVTIVR